MVRIVVSVLLCALLGACAAPSRFPDEAPVFLFQDDSFIAPPGRFRAGYVFSLSEPMRRFLAVDIARQPDLVEALVEALYTKGRLKLEYDTSMTRNASEAFDARAGNCLSLVIMTAAFARELGLRVKFQSAVGDQSWSRSGDLLLGSRHVNVTLASLRTDLETRPGYSNWLTVDFLPVDDVKGLPMHEISEATVIAMYMNNKAAEALVRGQLDDAYGWAHEAIRQAPQFASTYNTLGVVYERHGDLQQAARVFSYVLDREADNPTVLSNLAGVESRLGNESEAAALRRRLAQIDPHPPYYFFNLGMVAMERNDFRAAKALFAKEVARADYNHEFHFWLGAAYFKLGEIERARRQFSLALERSSTRGDREQYAAELAWLRQHDHAADSSPEATAPGPMMQR